jgi:DNA-binding IclR family transcriptional regulator
MTLDTDAAPFWLTNASGRDERDLHLRVLAEFREMPGLRLSLAQASRLFDIEPGRCRRVLGTLVEARCLVIDGDEFATADSARRSAQAASFRRVKRLHSAL